MSEPRRFNFSKVVGADELETLLTDPWFERVWWEAFEEGFREQLQEQRVEPVTPWEWRGETLTVLPDPPEYPEPLTVRRIFGTCMAVELHRDAPDVTR